MCIHCNLNCDPCKILESLVSPIEFLALSKDGEKDLKDAMEKLRKIKDSVMEVTATGTEQGKSQRVWLDKVTNIEGEVGEIEHAYAQCGTCLEDCCRHCCSIRNTNTRAAEKLPEVQALQKEGLEFDIVRWDQILAAIPLRLTPPIADLVGKESYVKKVRTSLEKDSVGIIGIWGMGGVGKTTILQCINNGLFNGENPSFNLVIWSDASQGFEPVNMQKVIFSRLGLPWQPDLDMQPRAQIINKILSGKSFLLLLDDLWKLPDLAAVGIPDLTRQETASPNKGKLVYTTHKDLSSSTECHEAIKVNCLEREEASELFKKIVGGRINNSSDRKVRDYAEEVCEWCAGLPIALIIIGKAISKLPADHQVWKRKLGLLRDFCNIAKIGGGVERDLYSGLKLSYDRLEAENRQKCFLCCSLWPAGCSIKKDELIECWMGLDLIDEKKSPGIDAAYEEGHSLIRTLIDAALLVPGNDEDKEVKMHNVIRGLALWLARENGKQQDKWLVREGNEEGDITEVEKWCQAECVSLIYNNMLNPFPDNLRKCSKLSTMMLQRSQSLRIIPEHTFILMPALTYLNLSNTPINYLPTGISNLKNLQYLNLSHTAIASLPREIKKLVKLKYLDLEGTSSLSTIPSGVLSQLINLRVLNLYESKFADWEVEGRAGDENAAIEANFKEFNNLQALKALGITVKTSCAIRRLLLMPRVPMRAIYITGLCASTDLLLSPTFLGSSGNMKSLKKLTIADCNVLEELKMGGEECVSSLEVLGLVRLPNITNITWTGVKPHDCLQNLMILRIDKCPNLKDVTWVLQLSYLAELHLSSCHGLDRVISKVTAISGGQSMASFPVLKRMILMDLPNLGNISDDVWSFSCMEELQVEKCPALKRLPLGLNEMSMRKIDASEEWWNKLEWDDDKFKSWILKLRHLRARDRDRKPPHGLAVSTVDPNSSGQPMAISSLTNAVEPPQPVANSSSANGSPPQRRVASVTNSSAGCSPRQEAVRVVNSSLELAVEPGQGRAGKGKEPMVNSSTPTRPPRQRTASIKIGG